MKLKLKIVDLFSISFILISLFLLFFFRSIPVTRIWNNYNVLYVEKKLPENQVLSILDKYGCKDVISLSSQRIPFFASFTPVEPKISSYIQERNSYFSDEKAEYNLYYIPSSYERDSMQALEAIKRDKSVAAGLDGTEQYPWLVPLIVLITFFIFLYFSQKKLVFAFPGIFFILFSFSMPFYPLAAFACLDLLALLLINHIWGRRKYILTLLTSPNFMLIIISSPVVFFVLGGKSGFLGILVYISAGLSLLLLKHRRDYLDGRASFSFKLIFSAKQIPLMYSRTSRLTIFSLMPLAAIFTLFLLSSVFSPKSSIQGLSVPSPFASNTEEALGKQLPSFTDYCSWAWQTLAFPYKNLNESLNSNKKAELGDTISITQYSEKNGVIEPSQTTIMEYNDDFIKKQKNTVEDLAYPAVEKLMLSQGSDTIVAYSTSVMGINKTRDNSLSLILLLLSLGEPALMYGLYYIKQAKEI